MTQNSSHFRLKEELVRGLAGEKKEHIEDSFISATSFLKALEERLEFKLDEKIKESESSFNYNKKNWDLDQAHMFGYREAIRYVLNLFVDNKQG